MCLLELVCELFLPCIFCHRYYKKKNKLAKSGYITSPSFDYYVNPQNYSVMQTHGITDVKTYKKYGRTFTIEEVLNGEHIGYVY